MSRLIRLLAMGLALMVGLTVTGTGAAIAEPGDPTIAYGLVTESQTDAPLTNLRVAVYDQDPAQGATKVADATIVDDDASMNYRVDLAAGHYWLVMAADGHKTLTVEKDVSDTGGQFQNLGGDRLDVSTGTLAGTVTKPNGEPSGCGYIRFFDATGDGSDYVDYTYTGVTDDAPGAYSRDLAIGTYKVLVSDDCGDYVAQWVGGTDFASATTYPVTADTTTTVAAVQLDDGASVSGVVRRAGTLTSSAAPLNRIAVQLVRAGASEDDEDFDRITTGADGAYAFPRVAPGSYRLFVSDPLNEYVSTSVDVTVTGTSDVVVPDVVLEATPEDNVGVTLKGKVVGPDKAGIPGIAVVAYGINSDDGGSQGSVLTKRDGTYALKLPATVVDVDDQDVPAVYKLRFIDEGDENNDDFDGTDYQSEWFDNVLTYSKAKLITVNTAAVTANAELVKNATISGKVTAKVFGDLEYADLNVDAYDNDGELAGNVEVDETSGAYTIKGLAPGSYKLKASGYAYGEDGGGELIRQYHSKKYSLTAGTAIAAANAGVYTGRDFDLGNQLTNVTAPKVSGTAKKGKKLTASAGSWSLSVDTEYAYQWYRGTTKLSGKTAPTYTVTSTDVGKTLSVRVVASNKYDDFEPSAAKASAATKKVVK